MRFYTFTNWILNSVQQGIQPGHCMGEMFIKYIDESPQKATLYDWATNHKTMICLNGGHYHGVIAVAAEVARFGDALQLPYANFHEDEQSLGGLMTCTGIVVPQAIYEAALLLRSDRAVEQEATKAAVESLTAVEIELALFLNQFGLAK
jgi:hypothetical protein